MLPTETLDQVVLWEVSQHKNTKKLLIFTQNYPFIPCFFLIFCSLKNDCLFFYPKSIMSTRMDGLLLKTERMSMRFTTSMPSKRVIQQFKKLINLFTICFSNCFCQKFEQIFLAKMMKSKLIFFEVIKYYICELFS